MRLLKSALNKSLEREEKLAMCSGEQAEYDGAPIVVELDQRYRDKPDPYSGEIREHITVIRFFRSQCRPQLQERCLVNDVEFLLTELYSQDEISTTFVVNQCD
ncbi:hypothetical protein [Pseudoalteromonas sp. S2755]|uniref:hypothetical protein n=1 Tax=Pseudoalteromonas sp. S2755 TaxID=2066523 RepID=UPI00110B1156|nr:hypothetical protein [Pseudoalteromonas sp. S2755]TMN34137.1 hypothetical protein CWC03_17250 [Pseudoalteromonas sp. S2755]